ncbi:MAG: hypothetical protein II592_05980, partial [Muribaculaceae bacterium]|nr:hypothetical protein [Muribaculaceae bacterium]
MGAFVDKASGKLKRVDEATMASLLIEPQLPMNYRDRRIILPKQGGQPCQAFRVMHRVFFIKIELLQGVDGGRVHAQEVVCAV